MTSIIAIGDIHLHPGERREQKLATVDQAIRAGMALGPAAWLFLGDQFHARSSAEDRNALAERIQRCAAIAPVGILKGNHDQEGELEIFGRLSAAWLITVFTVAGCYPMRLATGGNATLFALPYPDRSVITLAGVAVPDTSDAAAEALDAIFLKAAADLEQARAKNDVTLMIAHATPAGSVASNGQPQVGTSQIFVLPRHLEMLGSIPKLFGHIHRPQDVHGAVIVGSTSRGNFGEIEHKRFVVVNFGKGDEIEAGVDEREGWLHEIVSIPLDVPAMYYVEANLTRDGLSWACTAGPGGELQDAPTITCPPCNGTGDGDKDPIEGTLTCTACNGSGHVVSWKGCEVRVRCRYRASEFPVLDKQKLLAEFTEASLVQFDPIPEKDHALRAPEVAAAKTLAGKVAAWCAIGGTVAGEGVLQKLGRLETCDPVVVIENARDYAADIASGHEDGEKATVAA